jgi:hypothetical protein
MQRKQVLRSAGVLSPPAAAAVASPLVLAQRAPPTPPQWDVQSAPPTRGVCRWRGQQGTAPSVTPGSHPAHIHTAARQLSILLEEIWSHQVQGADGDDVIGLTPHDLMPRNPNPPFPTCMLLRLADADRCLASAAC